MDKNHLGMGVMINTLSSNKESVEAFKEAMGKKIKSLTLDEKAIHFEFEDGYKMKLFDDGQSCCESRYMRTDDVLKYYIGAVFMDAEIKEAAPLKNDRDDCDVHEIEFLDIKTDKGVFTLTSHNEHNGYYGGFSIKAERE